MSHSFRIGSLFGIPIFVHFTWLIIFALVTLSLVGMFAERFPTLPGGVQGGIGVIASLLFFASVLFHEMAHSLLAIHRGQPVRAITLFVFGGVSEIEKEAVHPAAEILIALIGPVSSYFLALAFGAIWYFSHDSMPVAGAIAGWLSTVNFALGTFNLLPGLPLDGGRVMRGVLWRITGDQARATRISGGVGRGLGYFFVLLGIWLVFQRKSLADGIWLVLIGFFLANAAEASMVQVKMKQAFEGVRADQVMTADCHFIPAGMSLTEFVDHFLLHTGRRCFVVGEAEMPRGIITLSNVRAVPRHEWPYTPVQAAMQPWDKVYSVSPGSSLEDVVRLLDSHRVEQVAVMQNGRLLGIIEREQVLQLIRSHMELAR
jgi:Zn-dependent protease/CBS domain-containing protein